MAGAHYTLQSSQVCHQVPIKSFPRVGLFALLFGCWTMMMMTGRLSLLLCIVLCSTPTIAFVVGGSSRSTRVFGVSSSSMRHANTAASSATSDDILKPPYDIERIPIRIGHGFDIRRMAPIQDAGQPIVIGGVIIPHSDQKVSFFCIHFQFNPSNLCEFVGPSWF